MPGIGAPKGGDREDQHDESKKGWMLSSESASRHGTRPKGAARWTRMVRSLALSLTVVAVLTAGLAAASTNAEGTPRPNAHRLSAFFKPAHKVSRTGLEATVHILRERLNDLGLRRATARVRGGSIEVDLPNARRDRPVATMIAELGQIFVRPALCGAPPFEKTARDPEPATAKLPTCTASSLLTVSNVGVSTRPGTTFSIKTVPPDQELTAYPNTSLAQDVRTKTVLLSGSNGAGEFARYLLGPAALTNSAFASAVAKKTQRHRWLVTYTLTPKGTSTWEAFAHASFHKIVAIELDGLVVAAPIIEPSRKRFASFGSREPE